MRKPIQTAQESEETEDAQDSVTQQPTIISTVSTETNQSETTLGKKNSNFSYTAYNMNIKFSRPIKKKKEAENSSNNIEKNTEQDFESFSQSFTESRREKFSKPIPRKYLDRNKKNTEEKDEKPQTLNLKQENIETQELLEKMLIKLQNEIIIGEKEKEQDKKNIKTHELLEKILIKLKNEPTISEKERNIIKNMICDIESTGTQKAIENIQNIISNNKQTITVKTLTYLDKKLEKFMLNNTSKVDSKILVPEADNIAADKPELLGLIENAH
ncbi:MAG: hypothetical protein ACIPMY_02315 [Rickettsia endosymbiont of Pentastiridius leporinus]